MFTLKIAIANLLFAVGYSVPILDQNTSYILKREIITENIRENRNLMNNFMDEGYISTDRIIIKHGYLAETHTVTTEDDYILTIHRILSKRNKNTKAVAFLQHGILGSSADWVLAGPEKGLAYFLVDAGYDVWMGNVRGNTYSKMHIYLDPVKDASKFWNFSWHEIGNYDLPSMIDYILKMTNKTKLFYIGHSQGTTTYYVMSSVKTQYNSKIIAQFSMAPVAYMKHVFSPVVRFFSLLRNPIQWIIKQIGLYEFLPNTELLSNLAELWCSDDSISQFLCKNALFIITGFNKKQINTTLLPTILAHTPAGSSTKQLIHFGQLVNSGEFQRYDYGEDKNLEIYSSKTPPLYNLTYSKAPIYLFYSQNDWMSAEEDVIKLESVLRNVKGKFLNPDSNWNHMDYIYGIEAKKLIYERMMSLMDRHLNN